MAWRLEKSVEHGEIDNTVPGTTTGRIWLRGLDEPLLLSLDGDCWRDLAGSRLEFTNPVPPQSGDFAALDPDQIGLIGDMTAALRVSSNGHRNSTDRSWRNGLYLEWFSETNGRVLIESTNFKLRVSDHLWRMDEDEEEAQKLANLQAMREFMARVIGREECDTGRGRSDGENGFDERLMNLSERVSRAFGEVLEKYGEDPESERKEAFVMGWDRKLESLAEREEAMNARMPPPAAEDAPDDDPDEDDWFPVFGMSEDEFDDDGFYCDEEPVIEKARELCLRAMDLVDREAEPGTPAYQLINSLLEVSSKLAGAFECEDDDDEAMGHMLIVLKRCLGFLNDSLSALQSLVHAEQDSDHKMALENLTSSIFSLRDDIVELRREIREEM